jgi:hypothetical protein
MGNHTAYYPAGMVLALPGRETFAIQVEQTLVFGSAGFVAGAYQDLE